MKPVLKKVKLSDVIFDEVIYPRKTHDPVLVQRYFDVLDEIEAAQKYISISEDNKLLDGKHRWLAYRKKYEGNEQQINVLVYPVSTPHEQLKIAANLNSDYGWQLTNDDKERTAKTLYSYGCTYEDIAKTLSVSKVRVTEWLRRIVKEEKDKRNSKIYDLWLSCHTQEEIAAAVGIGQRQVSEICDGFRDAVLENRNSKAAASHATDFEVPIYNIWKQQEKTKGANHFGNSEIRWVDNLLYLYTKPFDIVVDPFAGGGSTIDLCRKRFRRYWVSDRKPIIERENDIRLWDITEGLPPVPRWKDVRLVYLDPPYWKQAEGKYSNDPTDLANMSLDDFNKNLSKIVNDFAKKLKNGELSYIALLISPTQYPAPDHQYTDHIIDIAKLIPYQIHMRFSAPYESQQYSGTLVNWAKENKECLVLTREMVVWKIK